VNAQLELRLEPPKLRTSDLILGMLRDHEWWTPYDICNRLELIHGRKISDSNCTARLRSLRLSSLGGHNIESRRRAGSKAWEYRIVE
jgi:hypothetical protein